ncbi:MAG: oligopeptide:H+ symporter [Chitinophagales bacterium]|nr:oligopeptide:H+ symporter [Chitinophagales bacterium]
MKIFKDWSKIYPPSAPYIVGAEFAERFSFYGMKAILATFLVSNFFNPQQAADLQPLAEARSNEVTHLFTAISYGCCIIGGLIADRWLGRYHTILYLSIIYVIGHLFLAIFENNYHLFFTGLMLIALGAGGVKPNVSVMVGDQFENEDDPRINKLYSIFYFSINLGAFFSMLLTPVLKDKYGGAVAFAVPGALMLAALLIFVAGRKKYKIIKPSLQHNNFSFSQRLRKLSKVLIVFCFIPLYWALYDQNGSEWVLQAGKMDLKFMGITWLSEQIQVINAVLILVFIPLFSGIIYPSLEKLGIRINAYRKMGFGFLLMALTFLLTAWIQHQLDSGIKLNIAWQLLAYIILTASEILVSVTGLEFAFAESPKEMRSTVMSFWFFTVFVGNMLVSIINNNIHSGGFFSQLTGASYFLFFAGLMAGNTLLFIIVTYLFRKSYA